jgi:glycosyltransferase involved in cell wall biosynthesis
MTTQGLREHVSSIALLIDEDPTFDCRVQTALAAYPPAVTMTLDCSRAALARLHVRWRDKLALALAWPRILVHGWRLWRYLRREHGLAPGASAAGLRASWYGVLGARALAADVWARRQKVDLIYANDLICGAAGAALAKASGIRLVYDSHEVQFHRNRKNGWLRAAFDSFIESKVIAQADEVRVVNAAIAELYRAVYAVPEEKIRIVHNNHFALSVASLPTPSCATDIAVVYVGGGVLGRQLERLAAEAASASVPVHAFFIGARPEFAAAAGWHIGGPDYLPALQVLVGVRRCAIWCCVDDVCLSYRLALPNKFFQAMALGLPVIAAAGSYLAALVQEHDAGYVFDGANFASIAAAMQGPDYVRKAAAVTALRQALAAGSLRI